jgi:phospholipid/cholesterol/gamma-HCH transport system substrate-binding protein
MNKKSIDVWVGLLVVATLFAALFLSLKAGNLSAFNLRPTYEVTAQFDNIGGLKIRAPIKSAGVVVGRVAQISFDSQTFQAVATLHLESQYGFPKDTSAKILTSGLLGEQYIGLEAGGDVDNLKAGDKIKMTQSAVVLENLISQFLYSKAAEPTSTTSSASAPTSNTAIPSKK